MKKIFLVIGLLVFFAVGCGEKKTDISASHQNAEIPQNSKPIEALDPASAATLRGTILFEGEAAAPQEIAVRGNPECSIFHEGGLVKSEELMAEAGKLENVFIYIKEGLEGRTFETPTQPVEVDNKNCVYVPHVTGAMVGQPVLLVNSDPTLHNIHAYAKSNKSWNLGLPVQGMKVTKKFDAPEIMVSLKCDVHPWMIGYVGIVSHPYFAVSGKDGRFEIKNLPAGDYTVEAWHEKIGVQSQRIKIEPREEKEIEFKFA